MASVSIRANPGAATQVAIELVRVYEAKMSERIPNLPLYGNNIFDIDGLEAMDEMIICFVNAKFVSQPLKQIYNWQMSTLNFQKNTFAILSLQSFEHHIRNQSALTLISQSLSSTRSHLLPTAILTNIVFCLSIEYVRAHPVWCDRKSYYSDINAVEIDDANCTEMRWATKDNGLQLYLIFNETEKII